MGEGMVNCIIQSADEAFEKGMGAWGVQRDRKASGVVLYDAVLVEDDGPGACSSRNPTVEVGGPTRILKVFRVDRPEAMEAWLYLRRSFAAALQGRAKEQVVELNGRPLNTDPYSDLARIDPAWLRQGDNEVVVYCESTSARTVSIAPRADIVRNAPERHAVPPRSFRSDDYGQTWTPVDGEFLIRLHLVQYVAEGRFVSPVIDLGRKQADKEPIQTDCVVRSVNASWQGDTPEGTSVKLHVRTGPSPVFDDSLWTGWQEPGADVPAEHRYLQWQATLTTKNPTATPRLMSVKVEADVQPGQRPEWVDTVQVIDSHNEEILYTSIPFEYEDVNHPKLAELRSKHRLDEVVAGARTEFEKIVRIRDWVSKQWDYHPPEPPYPAWDTLEILRRREGFCVQYAIACMQCCLSLGLQARFVFGDIPGTGAGHEVCEVWSNEYGKWVYMDVNRNYHFIDPGTRVPLSLKDMHDLTLQTFYDGKDVTYENRPRESQTISQMARCEGLSLEPAKPDDEEGGYELRTKWLFIRMMPRNSFFSRRFPIPKNQGNSWNYTGYWQWEDERTPRQFFYGNFTAREADRDWTLNQVHFAATYGEEPNTINVQMGTFTPGFEAFEVRVGDGEWQERDARFAWPLQPGRNRLEMRVRTVGNVVGPISYIELTCGQQ